MPGVASTDHSMTDHGLVEGGITDEELTALALAADPDAPVADGVLPDPAFTGRGALPPSYMPAAVSGPRSRSRTMTAVAIGLVVMFLLITALGFCVTYGQLSFA